MKKLISCLLVLAIFISIMGNPNYSSASTVQEDQKIKLMEISSIIDNENQKELIINFPEENAYYKITATKNTNNKYNWTTTIGSSDKIYSKRELVVSKFSPSFSMTALAEKVKQADQQIIKKYYDENVVFEETPQIQPRVLPLIALGVYGLSASAIAAIELAMVGTLAVTTAAAVSDVLNQKKATSTITYPADNTAVTMPKWSEFSGIPNTISTYAQKHMEAALTQTISNRIKNNNNSSNNLAIFTSSLNVKGSVMVVYDITSSTSGKVNRHLANNLGGSKVDPTIVDETLDLNGYTVFLAYNHNTSKVFHAHFVPTIFRAKELAFNRYKYKYDIQIHPNFSRNSEYLELNNRTDLEQLRWEQRYQLALNNRNGFLLGDNKGNKSVVPRR
ncbi:hypothetical protein I6N90_19030 [Paenibacillus sp. GSMTC-2017]|uniref:hypothetical protein n=1 Tax=Paenibacillus sp. GSMTC-2017 TaxID=2794350 RepID=UPI0018D9053F|nr:hypothetical protein [Paenibacillus sp. GSMTC-2017]MBH5319897.1 hypothetical protein [Paenibacillus sp. GSMTC-2017]